MIKIGKLKDLYCAADICLVLFSKAAQAEIGWGCTISEDDVFFVFMSGMRVDGVSSIKRTTKGFELSDSFVAPAARGKGIYSKMLDARILYCKQNAISKIFCVTKSDIVSESLIRRGFNLQKKMGKWGYYGNLLQA